jgi:hypothetical protein
VEIAGRVMDNSLKGRLALVQRELMKGGRSSMLEWKAMGRCWNPGLGKSRKMWT